MSKVNLNSRLGKSPEPKNKKRDSKIAKFVKKSKSSKKTRAEKKAEKEALRQVAVNKELEKDLFVAVESPTQKNEEELAQEDVAKTAYEENKLAKEMKRQKITNVILVLLCVYVLFLTYGVVMTDFSYNENGKIEPTILSVKDIEAAHEFEAVLEQYVKLKYLYEQVLMLDYRMGEGVEDPRNLATEYEGLLEDVESLSVKTDALEVSTEYNQIKEMMYGWISNSMAVYLQKMSSAITADNSEDAQMALLYKDYVYNNFSLITSNLIVLGDNIKGIDMTEIKNWSPEGYVEKTIKGE